MCHEEKKMLSCQKISQLQKWVLFDLNNKLRVIFILLKYFHRVNAGSHHMKEGEVRSPFIWRTRLPTGTDYPESYASVPLLSAACSIAWVMFHSRLGIHSHEGHLRRTLQIVIYNYADVHNSTATQHWYCWQQVPEAEILWDTGVQPMYNPALGL